MKPILELSHLEQTGEKNNVLKDYNLIVNQGDIVYVQGLADSGITELLNVLTGFTPISGGRIYLYETLINSYSDKIAQENGIYFISSEINLVNKLTIADNLEAIKNVDNVWKYYNKKDAWKKVNEYLIEADLPLEANLSIEKLTNMQKKKISFIKAMVHNASLVVVDCMNDDFAGEAAKELATLMKKNSSEGTAFLILSRKYNVFAEFANTIQIIHDGRDIMQWHIYSECADFLMKGGVGNLFWSDKELHNIKKCFIGLYNFYWEPSIDIWEFLSIFSMKNSEYWNKYIDIKLLKAGVYFDGETAIIPKISGDTLVESLDIVDNIILTIPLRVSKNKFGIINENISRNVAEKYYDIAGVEKACKYVRELNYLQRKILSVYRWEIAKPKTIILENPYSEMDILDISIFRDYLAQLSEKGIKIIYLSNDLKALFIDCNIVFSFNRECKVNVLTAK